MSRPIISKEDLRLIVLRSLGAEAKVLNHKIEPFAVHRNGIMGNHFSLAISCVVEKETATVPRTINLFVKIPAEANPIADDWVVEEETRFFSLIYPLLMQMKIGHSEKWCPECYLVRRDILVFEDLRCEGFAVRSNSIFDEKSLRMAVAALARFHAATYALETRSNESFKCQFGPDALREKIFTNEGKSGQGNRLGFETLRKLASERFRLKDAHVLVPMIMERIGELVKPEADSFNVICHSDLWRNNIMFDDDTSPLRCILVDYQMLRYGPAVCDLVMMLFVHSAAESREIITHALLRHYHKVLRETLSRAGVEQSRIPEFEKIRRDYERRRLIGLAHAALRWPKIVFREVIDDPIKLRQWYFNDRVTLYQRAMDEDVAYEESARRCAEELLQEGRRVVSM